MHHAFPSISATVIDDTQAIVTHYLPGLANDESPAYRVQDTEMEGGGKTLIDQILAVIEHIQTKKVTEITTEEDYNRYLDAANRFQS